METFKFYIDQKITTWERTHFNIEANSKKEAVEKAKEILKEDNEYPVGNWIETLHEASSKLEIEQNGDCATRELFLDGMEIANNAED
jgi:hypothetical protein